MLRALGPAKKALGAPKSVPSMGYGVELPVAPRLSTFRLTAPTSCQPASAVAYMANISCVVSRFQLRLTQLMQLTELSGAFQKTKATDL